MSLRSWLKEYYVYKKRKLNLKNLRHVDSAVLLKWEGLIPSNVAKHNCDLVGNCVVERGSSGKISFTIDSSTCFWCKLFQPHKFGFGGCLQCAYQFGLITCTDPESPYVYWCVTQDPEPMINWIFQIISFRKEYGLYTLGG